MMARLRYTTARCLGVCRLQLLNTALFSYFLSLEARIATDAAVETSDEDIVSS